MKHLVILSACLSWPRLGLAQAPATLLSTVPTRQSITGSRTGPLSFSFSQPIANPGLIRLNAGQTQGRRAGTFAGAGTSQLTFQPILPFKAGERISVSVPAGISTPAQVIEFRAATGRAMATFGTMATAGPPPTNQPSVVTVGDMDEDGDLDLIASESTGARLCLNDGTGQFTAQTSQLTLADRADDLRLADFNGDGHLDLLASRRFRPQLSVYYGTGQGAFSAGILLPTPSFTVQLVTGDFNADGFSDAIIGEPAGSGTDLHLWLGSATGLLDSGSTSTATLAARDLAVADMDEDGDLDLLLLAVTSVSIYQNNGTGQFSAGATSNSVPSVAASLTVGDLTGDGHVDIACTSSNTAVVSVVPGTGTGGWQPVRGVTTLSRTQHVESGDLDGDADLDLLVTNDRGITQVLLNTGSGQFNSGALLVGFEAFSMAGAADLNGDSLLDIFTGNDVLNNIQPHGIDFFLNTAAIVMASTAAAVPAPDLYPNPARERVTVPIAQQAGSFKIELRDVLGRSIRQVVGQCPVPTGGLQLATSDLSPGFYTVQVTSSLGRYVKRLEIE